jgi:polyferredoxin
MGIQVIPLFLLPYIFLPWAGYNGWFDSGMGKYITDHLFPSVSYGHGREYWRAVGLILAWPLFIWNVFTSQPLTWWLVISFLQTFVLIPLIIRKWGKGAYCGWICSCGALAETMGDAHRHKMPHGPFWNRVNMVGQAALAAALLLAFARIATWIWPASAFGTAAGKFYQGLLIKWSVFGIQLNYYHVVDIFLAGIIGVGMYFWFSGRVWCRFACPLAALMHIYARFSRFRIFADKPKCISCNVCTSVCHQGIDIMNFANKGIPMEDPECVRCSACVQMCPTGTLSFGRIGAGGKPVYDKIPASPVSMKER